MHRTLRYPNRVLLGAAALGVCTDYFFNGRALGISVPLFLSMGLALLLALSASEGRRRGSANLWLGGLALCFGIGIMLRTTPLLVFLNLLAVLGAMLLLLAHYRGDVLLRLPLVHIAGAALKTLAIGIADPLLLMLESAKSVPAAPTQRLMPLGRGLLLALPIVGCFGGLLMSADSVFASYVWEVSELPFSWTLDLMRWIGHLLFAFVATYVCAGGLLAALGDDRPAEVPHLTPGDRPDGLPAEGDTQRLDRSGRRFLGFTEGLTVLIAVDILFGSFMLIQAAYFFGGIDTLDRTGMTYAEYARRGFFELLAVTCLALGLVWVLAALTQRVQRWKQRAFNASSTLLILCMLGMLSSAFQRLMLYEEAYGYTRLRLYTHSFMIWLAVLLPIFLIALYLNRFRIFLLGSLATAAIYLGLLNVVNTDALIVRENMARYQQGGQLDVFYLGTLSSDATPALLASLDTVKGSQQADLNAYLIQQYRVLDQMDKTEGWPSWNIGRARALNGLRQRYGPTPPVAASFTDDSSQLRGTSDSTYLEQNGGYPYNQPEPFRSYP
jgi:hypothetical protein